MPLKCSGFGELALLYSAPRAATVTATADCQLWVMERAFYNAIKHAHTEAASQQKRKLLDGIPLLALLRPVGQEPGMTWMAAHVLLFGTAAWLAGAAIADVLMLAIVHLSCHSGCIRRLQVQKQRLADALEHSVINDGQQLFPKDRAADRCFLLRSGAVQLTTSDGSVSLLTAGACIGERALVAGDNRCTLQAQALGNT